MRGIISVLLVIGTMAWAGTSPAQVPLGLPAVPVPDNNPQTSAKIALGKALFQDKRLSRDGSISCSSCHRPGQTFADGLPVAQGLHKAQGTRNTPTLLNVAYYATLFWDGRRPSLEQQVQDPLTNPVEHGMSPDGVLNIIRQDKTYLAQFRQVFGVSAQGVTLDHVSMALASFERTLLSGDSPFDRYFYAGDKGALTPEAVRGLDLFRGKALCSSCHVIGPNDATFTDNIFHNMNVGFGQVETSLYQALNDLRIGLAEGQSLDALLLRDKRISELGHMLVDPKRKKSSRLGFRAIGSFKTPTLRNVALTAPYMHDGSIGTLEEAVEMFDKGNESGASDPLFRPLHLSAQEKSDLVAFLKSLTSPGLPQ